MAQFLLRDIVYIKLVLRLTGISKSVFANNERPLLLVVQNSNLRRSAQVDLVSLEQVKVFFFF